MTNFTLFFLMAHLKINLVSFQTVSLGSRRIYSQIQSNITVPSLGCYDSLIIETQSERVIDIYITDCEFHVKLIDIQHTFDSGRNHLFSEYIAIGSNLTIHIETVSGEYQDNCSTILLVFDNWKDANTIIATGTWKQPHEVHCILEPTRYLFTPNKSSNFYFVALASQAIRTSLTGQILKNKDIKSCTSQSNLSSSCSISRLYLSKRTTVCTTIRNSNTSHSDIEYIIENGMIPLWKKTIFLIAVTASVFFTSMEVMRLVFQKHDNSKYYRRIIRIVGLILFCLLYDGSIIALSASLYNYYIRFCKL